MNNGIFSSIFNRKPDLLEFGFREQKNNLIYTFDIKTSKTSGLIFSMRLVPCDKGYDVFLGGANLGITKSTKKIISLVNQIKKLND